VACVLENRDTSIDVFDAQKTMEVCLAADRSADLGGVPVSLPLVDAAEPRGVSVAAASGSAGL